MLGEGAVRISHQVKRVAAARARLDRHLQRRVEAAQLARSVQLAGGLGDLLEPVSLRAPAALQRQVLGGLHLLFAQLLRARLERRRDRQGLPERVHRVEVPAVLVVEVPERRLDLERLRLVLELPLHLVDRGEQRLGIVRVELGEGPRIGGGLRGRLLAGAGQGEHESGGRGGAKHGCCVARQPA